MGYLLKYQGFKDALYESLDQRSLATSPDWQDRNSVIKYDEVPRDILEMLARDPVPDVPKNLLRSKHIDADLLSIIAEHEDDDVRRDVADHPKTQADVLLKLAKEVSHEVRWQVAENPNSTEEVLREIAKKEPTQSSFITSAIALNPNVTSELLYELTKKVVNLEKTDADRSYRTHLEAPLRSKKLDDRALSLINRVGGTTGARLRLYIASEYDLSDAMQLELAKEGDWYLLGELALDQPNLAKELQVKIANGNNLELKMKLLSSPGKIDVDVLDRLSNDPGLDEWLRRKAKEKLDKTDFTDWVFKDTWE